MDIRMICAIVSIVVAIGAIIAFMVYLMKTRQLKFRFFDVVAGMITVFSARQLLYSILARLISMIPGVSVLTQNTVFQPSLSAVLNTFVTVLGFWLLVRYIYYADLTEAQAGGIALGAAGFDVLWNLVSPLVSNVSYFIMKGNGTLESTLAKTYTQEGVRQIIAMYDSYGISYYLYFAAVALMIIANLYLVMVIFHDSTVERTRKTFRKMILIEFLYSLFYYFADPNAYPVLVAAAFVIAALLFWYADKETKRISAL